MTTQESTVQSSVKNQPIEQCEVKIESSVDQKSHVAESPEELLNRFNQKIESYNLPENLTTFFGQSTMSTIVKNCAEENQTTEKSIDTISEVETERLIDEIKRETRVTRLMKELEQERAKLDKLEKARLATQDPRLKQTCFNDFKIHFAFKNYPADIKNYPESTIPANDPATHDSKSVETTCQHPDNLPSKTLQVKLIGTDIVVPARFGETIHQITECIANLPIETIVYHKKNPWLFNQSCGSTTNTIKYPVEIPADTLIIQNNGIPTKIPISMKCRPKSIIIMKGTSFYMNNVCLTTNQDVEVTLDCVDTVIQTN